VELQHTGTAGCLVVTVDVLGDHRDPGGLFEVGDRLMGGIEPRGGDQAPAPVVPAPHQFRIAGEGRGRGQVLGPVATPQTVLFTPEGGDAAGGRNPGTGKHGDPGLGGQAVPDFFQRRAGVRIHFPRSGVEAVVAVW